MAVLRYECDDPDVIASIDTEVLRRRDIKSQWRKDKQALYNLLAFEGRIWADRFESFDYEKFRLDTFDDLCILYPDRGNKWAWREASDICDWMLRLRADKAKTIKRLDNKLAFYQDCERRESIIKLTKALKNHE